jgi:hypothetical protein
MEYWKTPYRILSTQGPRQTVFVRPSGLSKPFSRFQTITPVLHYSNNPGI